MRCYLGGYSLDYLADAVWFVALTWLAAHLAGAEKAGLILAAGTLPRAVVMIPGGTLADRLGVTKASSITFGVRLALMVLLGGLSIIGELNALTLAMLALLFGLTDGLHLPAVAALPVLLVHDDRLAAVQAMRQTINRTASVIGAPLAGLLLGHYSSASIGLCGALLLAAGWPLILRLNALGQRQDSPHQPASADESFIHGLGRAFRMLAQMPSVTALLAFITTFNLLCTAPIFLGVPLQAARYGWSAASYGVLSAVLAAAAGAGALSLLRLRPRHPVHTGLLLSTLSGAAVAALGTARTPLQAGLALTVTGLGVGPASALLIGHLQRQAPRDRLGRLMAFTEFSSVGLVPLGYMVYGSLASLAGPSAVSMAFGALQVAVVIGFLAKTRLRSGSR